MLLSGQNPPEWQVHEVSQVLIVIKSIGETSPLHSLIRIPARPGLENYPLLTQVWTSGSAVFTGLALKKFWTGFLTRREGGVGTLLSSGRSPRSYTGHGSRNGCRGSCPDWYREVGL